MGGSEAEEGDLKRVICEVMELAEEGLGCNGIVMVLEKNCSHLG